MSLYAIFRRNLCAPEDLEAVDRRSQAELDRRSDEVRKVRSFVLKEPNGMVGTICVYEATSPEVVIEHGQSADVGVDEVVEVTGIDVHRPDPEHLMI
jgi:hypothetical protein